MIQEIVFSCSGTTRKIADAITTEIGRPSTFVDLTDRSFEPISISDQYNIVLFAVPVWGGRIPAIAAERLRQIKSNGQKAIAVVVYGNRDYDDALLELCDIVTEQGFTVVAAAAFIAEHCIFPSVATNRPDDMDSVAISRFAHECKAAIANNTTLDLTKIKGHRPYKNAGGVPLQPKTDDEKCVKCRVCFNLCPYEAIDYDTLETDKSKCAVCCRCISVCAQKARVFSGLTYKTVKFGFEKMFSKRREPEFFV